MPEGQQLFGIQNENNSRAFFIKSTGFFTARTDHLYHYKPLIFRYWKKNLPYTQKLCQDRPRWAGKCMDFKRVKKPFRKNVGLPETDSPINDFVIFHFGWLQMEKRWL